MYRPLIFINRSVWLKRLWVMFALLSVLIAFIMTGLRALTPWINQHKTAVEGQLSALFGESVSIQQMETGWHWFQPVLSLNGVLVSQQGHPVLELKHLLLGVNVLSSLYYWQIQPGILMIDHVRLTLRETDRGWTIDGIHQGAQSFSGGDLDALKPLARWILLQKKVKIKNVSARLYFKDGSMVSVPSLMLKAVYRHGRYRMKSIVYLGQNKETRLFLEGELSFISDLIETTEGELYFSIKHLNFSSFERFLKPLPYYITNGSGDLQAWISMQNGHISLVQSSVMARDFEWHKQASKKPQLVQKLTANIAWKPTPQGGQWSGDHLIFETKEKTWVDNAFLLEYQKQSNRYRLYLKFLPLDSFLWNVLDWPEQFRRWLDLHPEGYLQTVQIGFSKGIIDYFLARFSHFGWKGSAQYPTVHGLSGAVHWEPLKGQLALDSKHIAIQWNKRKEALNQLNLLMGWQVSSDGMRVHLKSFDLDHPQLSLHAQGILDHYRSNQQGDIQLNTQYAAKHAEYWLPYIPTIESKPKLDHWLKKDIQQIANATGTFNVKGPLSDLSFETESMLKGVDLRFHPEWPILSNIDGSLEIKDHRLTSTILSSTLGSKVKTQALHLSIDALGSGQERIKVDGKIQANAPSMMEYVLKTPLKNKLSRLAMLHLKQLLDLDIFLDIPLNATDQEPLKLSGSILFEDNQAHLELGNQSMLIDHLLGTLFFNETGILDSALSAYFLEQPIRLDVKGVKHPQQSTQIDIHGVFPWRAMRHQWHTLPLELFEGQLPIHLQLNLSHDVSVWDQLKLESDLLGTGIVLPAPYEKLKDAKWPSALSMAFNWKKGIHLQAHVGDGMHADVWFADENKEFMPLRGLVCFACTAAHAPSEEVGIVVDASLKGKTNASVWQSWVQQRFKQTSSSSNPPVKTMNLRFSTLMILGQQFKAVEIRAEHVSPSVWRLGIQLNQKPWGELVVDWANQKVSGHIQQFILSGKKAAKTQDKQNTSPSAWPNLEITIDELLFGEKLLGQCVLRGTKETHAWRMNELAIQDEAYQFKANGLWSVQKNSQKTIVEAQLNIKKLHLLLEKWGIPPVVESKGGTLTFEGGWGDALDQFSLKHTEGNMYIQFKEGRITHFDPETEQKLGLGKLLSILSLQTIPRRLKLDFSDLANDGYSFDYFKGHFNLNNGLMTTEDSIIDGPVAYASIKGSLDLIQRLYHLDLRVMPHITASLPVVATIAGGPIAGVATWFANKLLTTGVDKVSGYTYTITGPWFNPVVKQVHIYRKKQPH